jgi:hypothetical protein
MADNVAITAGTGTNVAADDIAGVYHQRVKISQGADGSATDVSSAAPLNVTLANGSVPSHAVTNAGTFAVQVSSIAAGTNNIGDVDVVTLPALPAGNNNIGDVDVASLPALASGSNTIGKVEHTTTGIGHGVKTITAAGTDEALAGSTAAKWVTIQAQTDNTTRVAVGGTGVDATVATGNGISLAAGETITLAVDNLADVFVDALTNGEGVRYTYGS